MNRTEELQYLGQMLMASTEKDATKINFIIERLNELNTVKLSGQKAFDETLRKNQCLPE